MKQYYMLMTSLPRHGKQYKLKETPISRIQLEKRFKLLTNDERNLLSNLINCVWDSWFNPGLPLNETINKSNTFMALHIPFIQEVIQWFFDVRSIFVALRLRQIQSSPPTNPQEYWSTQLTTKLIKNWDKPDFGLKYMHPWVTDLSTKITNKDTAFIEDTFLSVIWEHLNKIENRHFYDFEALIIYLIRWNIVNYWSQLDEKVASNRIREISESILMEKQ